jgi:hypothetical protein
VAHRTVSGLITPACGFADDLVLCRVCTETAKGMNRLLIVVAENCRWSGMRVKLKKTAATAFDFLWRQELSTEGVLYQGTWQPFSELDFFPSFLNLFSKGIGIGYRV